MANIINGGPIKYRSVHHALFVKSFPSSIQVVKKDLAAGTIVHSTGRIWTGPQGGTWAELDASKGSKAGWALIQGPGFDIQGAALIEVSEQQSSGQEKTAQDDMALDSTGSEQQAKSRYIAASTRPSSAGDACCRPSVYAASDLHTDYPANMAMIRALPARPNDAIILAGDISHDLNKVRETFQVFLGKFRYVLFCPGNHDLWLHHTDKHSNSIAKLHELLSLCEELGVHTRPLVLDGGILILPLLSWYDLRFDQDPDVHDASLTPIEQTMMDFHLCKWPAGLSPTDGSLAAHFDALNADTLYDVCHDSKLDSSTDAVREQYNAVISFSHFLPRLELLPEKRYLFYPHLPKAVGSQALRDRVQKIKPDCHVFGHSHYGWDAEVDGIRYLQAAIAYPQERVARGFALRLLEGSGGIVGGETSGGLTEPVLVYDASRGILPRWTGFWSGYYSHHVRRPKDVRWLYREPRVKASVGAVLKELVDAGEDVDDDVVSERLTKQIRVA